jgi:ssRNA-specific RNase YbeY (16S rRNA maturation enzyme)
MRLREQGKVKGHHYWPTSKSKPKVYGDIVVSLKKAKQVEEVRSASELKDWFSPFSS